jgi:hypothetical protein
VRPNSRFELAEIGALVDDDTMQLIKVTVRNEAL